MRVRFVHIFMIVISLSRDICSSHGININNLIDAMSLTNVKEKYLSLTRIMHVSADILNARTFLHVNHAKSHQKSNFTSKVTCQIKIAIVLQRILHCSFVVRKKSKTSYLEYRRINTTTVNSHNTVKEQVLADDFTATFAEI